MSARFQVIAVMCVVAAFSACGKRSEPPPVKDTVFGGMMSTKDKARDVQKTMDDRSKQISEQMQKSEEPVEHE